MDLRVERLERNAFRKTVFRNKPVKFRAYPFARVVRRVADDGALEIVRPDGTVKRITYGEVCVAADSRQTVLSFE